MPELKETKGRPHGKMYIVFICKNSGIKEKNSATKITRQIKTKDKIDKKIKKKHLQTNVHAAQSLGVLSLTLPSVWVQWTEC